MEKDDDADLSCVTEKDVVPGERITCCVGWRRMVVSGQRRTKTLCFVRDGDGRRIMQRNGRWREKTEIAYWK